MFIYCIENKINGKQYVGLTTGKIKRRFKRHADIAKTGGGQYIHSAIRKHGINNFEIKQLDMATSLEDLYRKEKYWIEKLNTLKEGYNLTAGGEGSHKRTISEETKEKHRQNALRRYRDPKFKEKISQTTKEGMKKWWNDLSQEDKIAYVEKCKKRPEGYIPAKGFTYTHSEDAKIAIGNYNRGKIVSEATREKIRKNRIGKGTGQNNSMNSEENRKKVSDGLRRHWETRRMRKEQ